MARIGMDAMRDRLKARMLELLLEVPEGPARERVMRDLDILVVDNNLYHEGIQLDMSSPEDLVHSLFQEGTPNNRLVRAAIQAEFQGEEVGSPEELLLHLLPSDHHLD